MQMTSKKSLQFSATTFQEIDEHSGAERIYLCNICKTYCYSNEFKHNEDVCIFCSKKTNQFNKIKVFTFKPCLYFFHKLGISKNDLELAEYEQMICGIKTNFLEYNSNNLIWYIYEEVEPVILYKKFIELFDFYKDFNVIAKNCLKNTSDKFKYMFLNKYDYISINLVVNDFQNDQLNFSSFLPRERLFI
jgi:hypothetical protein